MVVLLVDCPLAVTEDQGGEEQKGGGVDVFWCGCFYGAKIGRRINRRQANRWRPSGWAVQLSERPVSERSSLTDEGTFWICRRR
jgi:hypothetical protein